MWFLSLNFFQFLLTSPSTQIHIFSYFLSLQNKGAFKRKSRIRTNKCEWDKTKKWTKKQRFKEKNKKIYLCINAEAHTFENIEIHKNTKLGTIMYQQKAYKVKIVKRKPKGKKSLTNHYVTWKPLKIPLNSLCFGYLLLYTGPGLKSGLYAQEDSIEEN